MNAAIALARIGPSAAEAAPDLVRALDDDDRYASAWAAHRPAAHRHPAGNFGGARPSADHTLVPDDDHRQSLLIV